MTRRPTNFVFNGKTAPWHRIRAHVLCHQPICQICKVAPSTEVDHIWPKYYGGDDHEDNLQGVCKPCNQTKGNKVTVVGASNRNILQALLSCDERIRFEDSETGMLLAELTERFQNGDEQAREYLLAFCDDIERDAMRIVGKAKRFRATAEGRPLPSLPPDVVMAEMLDLVGSWAAK